MAQGNPYVVLNGRDDLASIKMYLDEVREDLRIRHRDGASGAEIVATYTASIDGLIGNIFGNIAGGLSGLKDLCLVALGGYGRCELNIRSDIDLMLLYPRRIDSDVEAFAEKLLYLLWDTGLDVGFSVRSLRECIDLASEDIKTKTAVLDSRLVVGNEGLFSEYMARVFNKIFHKKALKGFVCEKISESKSRHARYGGSVYILEPNIKEGEGGLRDFHSALWMAKALEGISGPEGMVSGNCLSAEEFTELRNSVDFLWKVRNDLHFETRKKSDQLTFDHQERIAGVFGYPGTNVTRPVEEFMIDYYMHASNVNRYSSLAIRRLLYRSGVDLEGMAERPLDGDFSLRGNFLVPEDGDIFAKRPDLMMKAFTYIQSHGAKLDGRVRDLILDNLFRVDDDYRRSKEVSTLFLDILKGDSAFEALSEMHDMRFLARYIPEFEDITHRMQHDMYHVYTVDVHSLFAVRELERLGNGYKSRYPLLSRIYRETERPELLKLAVILHDIGKSRGKGHAEKGADMTVDICERLGLSEDETGIVVFLVRYHLTLADTAQYRDLHDEKLIISFAETVGAIERLNMLYLLTFADISAVGPDVWTKWKGALFQELYLKTLIVLERGTFETEDTIRKLPRIKAKLIATFDGELPTDAIEGYFQLLPQRYFLANGIDVIAEHIRIVRALQNRPFLMKIRQNKDRQYTEVTLCTIDSPGLFSKVTGVMVANGINILGAQINTLRNGIALDVLQVNSATGGLIVDQGKWDRVERDMESIFTGEVSVARLVARRKPSILDKKIKPRVYSKITIDNEVSDYYTVIDVHTQDRIGLLYNISNQISKLGLYVAIAKITTNGDEAADIFYVKDIFGQKIYYEKRLKEIRDALYKVLGEEPPCNGGCGAE